MPKPFDREDGSALQRFFNRIVRDGSEVPLHGLYEGRNGADRSFGLLGGRWSFLPFYGYCAKRV